MYFLSSGFLDELMTLVMFEEVGDMATSKTLCRPKIVQVRSVNDLGKAHYGLCLTDGESAMRVLVEKHLLEDTLGISVKEGAMISPTGELQEWQADEDDVRVDQLRVGSVISVQSFEFIPRLAVFVQNETGETATNPAENLLPEVNLLDILHIGFSCKNLGDPASSHADEAATATASAAASGHTPSVRKEMQTEHSTAAAPGSVRQISSLSDLTLSLNNEAWQIVLKLVNLSERKYFSNSSFTRALFKDESNDLYCEAVAFADNCNYLLRLDKDHSYVLTRCSVRVSQKANRRWRSQRNSIDFELTIDSQSKLTKVYAKPCNGPPKQQATAVSVDQRATKAIKSSMMPSQHQELDDAQSTVGNLLVFTKLGMLPFKENNSFINVTGVVCEVEKEMEDVEKKGWRSGKLRVRYFYLADETSPNSKTVRCSVWGAEAEAFDHSVGAVLLLRNCLLTEYNGVTLCVYRTSTVADISFTSAAEKLRDWWPTSQFCKKRKAEQIDAGYTSGDSDSDTHRAEGTTRASKYNKKH